MYLTLRGTQIMYYGEELGMRANNYPQSAKGRDVAGSDSATRRLAEEKEARWRGGLHPPPDAVE